MALGCSKHFLNITLSHNGGAQKQKLSASENKKKRQNKTEVYKIMLELVEL